MSYTYKGKFYPSPELTPSSKPFNISDGWYSMSRQAKAHYISDGYALCCGDYIPTHNFKPRFPLNNNTKQKTNSHNARGTKCIFCEHANHFMDCFKCQNDYVCIEGIILIKKVLEKEE